MKLNWSRGVHEKPTSYPRESHEGVTGTVRKLKIGTVFTPISYPPLSTILLLKPEYILFRTLK